MICAGRIGLAVSTIAAKSMIASSMKHTHLNRKHVLKHLSRTAAPPEVRYALEDCVTITKGCKLAGFDLPSSTFRELVVVLVLRVAWPR